MLAEARRGSRIGDRRQGETHRIGDQAYFAGLCVGQPHLEFAMDYMLVGKDLRQVLDGSAGNVGRFETRQPIAPRDA